MNQKHAREARIVNRVIGNLAKKSDLPINEENGVVILGAGPGQQHKLPRRVKRAFERRPHREKGKVTRHWRSGVAHSLKARGVEPKGNTPRRKPPQMASRSVRAHDRKILNRFENDLRQHIELEHLKARHGIE